MLSIIILITIFGTTTSSFLHSSITTSSSRSSSKSNNIFSNNIQMKAIFDSSSIISSTWTDNFGTSALGQVQSLANLVSDENAKQSSTKSSSSDTILVVDNNNKKEEEVVVGGGESTEKGTNNSSNMKNKNQMSGDTDALFSNLTVQRGIKGQNSKVVLSALESLEKDSKLIIIFVLLFFQLIYF